MELTLLIWWVILLPIVDGYIDKYLQVLNQTTFSWVDLSESELSRWYAPVDLCILNSSNRLVFPQEIRANDCYHFSKGSRRQFCGVGMGNNNYPCYGPFNSARKHFKRGIDGFSDPDSKPLLSFFAHLHLMNSTFLMLGDSTMRQKLQALQCELSRETNGQAKFYGNVFGILPCDTFLTIYFPSINNRRFSFPPFRSLHSDEKMYKIHPLADQAVTLYAISLGPKSIDCYTKILSDRNKTHMNPTQDYRLMNHEEDPAATVDLFRTETEGIFGNAARYVNELNYEQSRNVFVFANMGLWYNLPVEYGPILPVVFKWMESIAKRANFHNIIAWHETFRQHWQNIYDQSGNYDKTENFIAEQQISQTNLSNVRLEDFIGGICCSKIRNHSRSADWRNEMVRQVLSNSTLFPDIQNFINVFPMANITMPLEDMHTCNPIYRHDCTHYCFWPLFLQVLWNQLEALVILKLGPLL